MQIVNLKIKQHLIGGSSLIKLTLILLCLHIHVLKQENKYLIVMEEEVIDFCLFGMDLHILIISMIVLHFDSGIKICKN